MGEIKCGGVKLVGKVAGKLVDRQPTSATRWHFDVVVVLMPLFYSILYLHILGARHQDR